MKKNTIVAIATPSGRGAVGIVKISGERSREIVLKLTGEKEPEERKASLAFIKDPKSGEVLDQGIVIYFKGPGSQTGEDMAEFHLHGNPILLKKIVKIIIELGARPAEPGEFTRRAFENGKIDLLQAESIAEIVSAKTEDWLRQSALALSGKSSQKLFKIREELLEAMVKLETFVEFPEDEATSEIEAEKIIRSIEKVKESLSKGLLSYNALEKIRDAGRVVITGSPNVGKSSLFNKLLGYERVIISSVPGTTRDFVEEILDARTLISIVDTAGLRESQDKIEKMSIEKTREILLSANLVLVIIDATKGPGKEEEELFKITSGIPKFLIINKIDKVEKVDEGWTKNVEKERIFLTSAYTGEGVDDLKKAIFEFFSFEDIPESDLSLVCERQIELAQKSLEEMNSALRALKNNFADIASEHLRQAGELLAGITGEITNREILDRIFSTFCIGK